MSQHHEINVEVGIGAAQNKFRAWVKGNRGISGAGKSIRFAIGDMMLSHPQLFSLAKANLEFASEHKLGAAATLRPQAFRIAKFNMPEGYDQDGDPIVADDGKED